MEISEMLIAGDSVQGVNPTSRHSALQNGSPRMLHGMRTLNLQPRTQEAYIRAIRKQTAYL